MLAADDVDDLMNWLAQQPLLQQIGNDDAYMSHAGISPQWNLQQAKEQAKLTHTIKLSATKRDYWLSAMYGEKPDDWQQANTAEDRFRYTINSLSPECAIATQTND